MNTLKSSEMLTALVWFRAHFMTAFFVLVLLVLAIPVNAGTDEEVLVISESPGSGSTEAYAEIYPANVLNYQVVSPTQSSLEKSISSARISNSGVSLSAAPLNSRSQRGGKPFSRIEGFNIGIPHLALLDMVEFKEPQNMGRGIASGDINKDGFVDVVLATENGVLLYINNGGLRFEQVELGLENVSRLNSFVVALVDINNDGWLDIFFTTYLTGNYFLLNEQGRFHKGNLKKAPSPRILTESLAFGDIDKDGDLDAILGNWVRGTGKGNADEHTLNTVALNEGGEFSVRPLKGVATGDTLSVLLSDFTGDNNLDLIVGNDFKPPDIYYRGDGKGNFEEIAKEAGIIPESTNTTMSLDTADYDNDLDLDIYTAQVAAAATGPSVHIASRRWSQYCNDLTKDVDRERCLVAIKKRILVNFRSYTRFDIKNIKQCDKLPVVERDDCTAMHVYLAAILKNKKELCELIPDGYEDTRFHCDSRWTSVESPFNVDYRHAIPVIRNENVLLRADADGKFENIARPQGVETTGWSWNAKFADFDNDEFQDIYVANGFWSRFQGAHTKFFFHNQRGLGFNSRADAFGLQNYMVMPAFTEIDVDNDGDLDILATSVNGPVWFYKNNNQHNNAVEFEIKDTKGNYFGIGGKIIIHYGEKKARHQLRESKSGGGFLSFNSPTLHFGLANHEVINRIEIYWSTGEYTEIKGQFPVNAKYLIARH